MTGTVVQGQEPHRPPLLYRLLRYSVPNFFVRPGKALHPIYVVVGDPRHSQAGLDDFLVREPEFFALPAKLRNLGRRRKTGQNRLDLLHVVSEPSDRR